MPAARSIGVLTDQPTRDKNAVHTAHIGGQHFCMFVRVNCFNRLIIGAEPINAWHDVPLPRYSPSFIPCKSSCLIHRLPLRHKEALAFFAASSRWLGDSPASRTRGPHGGGGESLHPSRQGGGATRLLLRQRYCATSVVFERGERDDGTWPGRRETVKNVYFIPLLGKN